jgi:hypothetical protein
MKEEGARNLKNIKQAGAASAELSGTVNALAATQEINTDGLKQANAEQANSAKTTDGLNKQVEESKAKLAAFSNGFQMALANSGMLDVLMSAFEMLANFAMQYLVPAMGLIFGVVQKVWSGFTILLAPVIESISSLLGGAGLSGTIEMIDSAMNAVFPVLSAIVRAVILAVEGLWNGLMQLVQPLENLWGLFGELGGSTDILTDIILIGGELLGGMFEVIGAAIGLAINAVVDITRWFMSVVQKSEFLTNIFNILKDAVSVAITTFRKYMSAEGLKSLLAGIGDGFMGLIDDILAFIGPTFGGISEEEKKKRDDERAERAKARDARMDAVLEEKNAKLEVQKQGVKQDSAKFQQQKLHMSKMGGLQKDEEDAKKKAADAANPEVVKNYNDPIALMKAELTQQKSDIIPKSEIKSPTSGVASADVAGATKALEAAAEKKKQEVEQKAKEEAEKKKQEADKKPATTQESATTLLAELNTKMALLIKHAAGTQVNTYETYNVTKGLSGNLFKG